MIYAARIGSGFSFHDSCTKHHRFVGRAQNPYRRRPSSASASWSLQDPDGPTVDRCHSCLLPIRLHRETAPTSENEPHLSLRRPQQQAFRTPEPSCPQANHRTNPPPQAKEADVGLHRSMKTSADADRSSCQYRDDQESQQTQCASQNAARLKISARNNTQLFHLSLNLVKSLLQDFSRLGQFSRFGTHQQF